MFTCVARAQVNQAPTITLDAATPSPFHITENGTNTIHFTITDPLTAATNLQVVATTDNPVLLPAANVIFTGPDTSGNVTAEVVPAQLQSGSNNLTLTVRRNDGSSSSVTLPVIVDAINVPPTISGPTSFSMLENTTNTIEFLVSDPDTPLSNLIIQVESTNGTLLPNASCLFFGQTNELIGLPANDTPRSSRVVLWLGPNPFQTGESDITVTLMDPRQQGTNIITSRIKLSVTPVVYPPFISSIPTQVAAPGTTVGPIPFQVSSPVFPASVLTLVPRSSDQTLVEDGKISFTGLGTDSTNRTLTITVGKSTGGGMVTIALTVSDGTASANTRFSLLVIPDWGRPNPHNENTFPIAIVDNSIADPYPSTLDISNYNGRISKLSVMLYGFTHSFASDVGVLLVGPSGQKTVLMNNVATGRPGLTNVDLTFDQSASGPVPTNLPVVSGIYTPIDNSGGRVFSGAGAAPPYTNTLEAFNGTSPNGKWALYAQDFLTGDSGIISNGWGLSITTAPVIKGLGDAVSGTPYTTLRLPFTVGDDSGLAASYTFRAVSDNPNVVTNGGMLITGSGTNWMLTINPVPYSYGTAQITITLADQFGAQAAAKFPVILFCDFPTLWFDPVPDQSISAGGLAVTPLPWKSFCVDPSQVRFSLGSSDTTLLPLSNMKLVGTNLQIWAGALIGSTRITIRADPAWMLSTNLEFQVNVLPAPLPLFANTNEIQIADNQPATPFPSDIEVKGQVGEISHLTVTLLGMTHQYPSDVSVLLVGPQGQKVVLMGRAGGSVGLTNTWLSFDDATTNILPQFTLINDGTYQPAGYKASDTFFLPAPFAPYGHALSDFDGTNPNGIWSLYVQDDQPQQNGAIAGGWILSIETVRPKLPNLVIIRVHDMLTMRCNGGTPNAGCALQSAGDLETWMSINATNFDSNGSAEFQIELTNAPTYQFYRLLTR
jgi:subtilisin-like proprotein convertase family protein